MIKGFVELIHYCSVKIVKNKELTEKLFFRGEKQG
jgi:hypothetical protein